MQALKQIDSNEHIHNRCKPGKSVYNIMRKKHLLLKKENENSRAFINLFALGVDTNAKLSPHSFISHYVVIQHYS